MHTFRDGIFGVGDVGSGRFIVRGYIFPIALTPMQYIRYRPIPANDMESPATPSSSDGLEKLTGKNSPVR